MAVAAALSGCPTETSASQTQAAPITAPAIASDQLPADLHSSPADTVYLASVDASTRQLAIQRRRYFLQANLQLANLSKGYTDSLKTWSIADRATSKGRRK